MHTLFDFISDVNSIQYGLALLFILGFVIFCEILKPRPFEGLATAVVEDVKFIRAQGSAKVLHLSKNIALAPMYILFYLAAVPVLFVQGMTAPLGRIIADMTTVGWSPVRAYFTGRRKRRKAKRGDKAQRSSD